MDIGPSPAPAPSGRARATRIALVGPPASGRASNLDALASMVLPEPCVRGGLTRRLDLVLRAPWSGEDLPVTVEAWLTIPAVAEDRRALAAADCFVFVADSAPGRMDANVAALDALERALAESGRALGEVPHVLQYNKRDLRVTLAACELRGALNRHGADEVEAVACRGRGVLTTLVLAVHALSPRRSRPPPLRAADPVHCAGAPAFGDEGHGRDAVVPGARKR